MRERDYTRITSRATANVERLVSLLLEHEDWFEVEPVEEFYVWITVRRSFTSILRELLATEMGYTDEAIDQMEWTFFRREEAPRREDIDDE